LEDQPLGIMNVLLKTDLLGDERLSFEMRKISIIIYMVSGSTFFIASMMLVVHTLRSYGCLYSTYHHLVFGFLSAAAEIISSNHGIEGTNERQHRDL
jgi:hypothetical protein